MIEFKLNNKQDLYNGLLYSQKKEKFSILMKLGNSYSDIAGSYSVDSPS